MTNGQEQKLPSEELVKALRCADHLNFNMLGLASAIGSSPSIPSYKTLMGKEVEASIVPTDSHIFIPGHALARKKTGETIGFSSFQGKIWSLKRGTITQFISWCNEVAANINMTAEVYSLRDIPYLNPIKTAWSFSSKPIVVTVDPHISEYIATIIHHESGKEDNSIIFGDPIFEIVDSTDKDLFVTFYPNFADKTFSINMSYNISNNSWAVADSGYYELKLEPSNAIDGKLNFRLEYAFQEEFPPFIYLTNGTLINGRTLIEPKPEYKDIPFPEECFVKGLVWDDCNINKEFLNKGEAVGTKKTIHDWLESWLSNNLPPDSIIFKDHESGEIADFIAIQPDGKIIGFYHCKSSSTKQPGASIGHISAVMDQVLRSISLVNTRTLVDRLLEHSDGRRPRSKFIRGDRGMVNQLKDTFSPLDWSYQVFIVQPGLDCKEAAVYENTKLLLLTCYEWLKDIGAKLRIMGFYK